MASDESSASRSAAPIVLRIKLRYADVEVMVQRFAANVGKSGLFLPTRSLQPIGAEIKFELRVADDTAVLVGLGRVKAVRAPDPHNPRAAFGMTVELMRVTPQSRGLILRMLERRRELGLAEVNLPTAEDIDAARRPGDQIDPATGPVIAPAATGPLPVVAVAPPAAPGDALLTAPRRTTGPLAVAKVAAIAPLAPEPPRKRRAPLAEIIERASGPVATAASMPGLDDNVDIAATIARARALAGDAPDAELDALSEATAAPIEISIDAASAELARQLGGSAVRRDRSAGWAPPPATTAATTAHVDEPAAADDAEPIAALAEAPVAEAPVAEAPVAEAPVAEAPVAPGDDAGHASFDDVFGVSGDHEPVPAADADAAADDERIELALSELDSDERTELGGMPDGAPGFSLPADVDEPEEPDPADEDDENADDDDPGDGVVQRAGQPAPGDALLELGIDEFDDFEILAEADANDEDLLGAHGEEDASQRRRIQPRPQTAERRPSELDFASRLDLGDDSDRYTMPSADDFSAHHVIDGLQDELTGQHHAGDADPFALSAGAALAALETGDDHYSDDVEVTDDPDAYEHRRVVRPIFEPEPSSSVTLANIPSDSIDLDSPSQRRPEPIESLRPRAQPATRPEPRPTGRPEPRPTGLSLHEAPVEDYELEHALEALDVDLDDLSIPHAATQLQRDTAPPPAAGRPGPSGAPNTAGQRAPAGSQPRVPVPAVPLPRATVPAPRPQRATGPAAVQPRAKIPTPAPQPRAPLATPSRAIRHSDMPVGARAAVPRAPTDDGVDIDFDDDD